MLQTTHSDTPTMRDKSGESVIIAYIWCIQWEPASAFRYSNRWTNPRGAAGSPKSSQARNPRQKAAPMLAAPKIPGPALRAQQLRLSGLRRAMLSLVLLWSPQWSQGRLAGLYPRSTPMLMDVLPCAVLVPVLVAPFLYLFPTR